jgi:DNA transformation protein
MPISNEEREVVSYTVDLLLGMGPVYSKGMCGGFGVFIDGFMFALIANNKPYLKVDGDNLCEFESLGVQPFTFEG